MGDERCKRVRDGERSEICEMELKEGVEEAYGNVRFRALRAERVEDATRNWSIWDF